MTRRAEAGQPHRWHPVRPRPTLSGMNVALRKPWTMERFLEWEERQELRYEFDGFQPEAMTGGTAAHDRIKMNLSAALVTRLRDTVFHAFGNGLLRPHVRRDRPEQRSLRLVGAVGATEALDGGISVPTRLERVVDP